MIYMTIVNIIFINTLCCLLQRSRVSISTLMTPLGHFELCFVEFLHIKCTPKKIIVCLFACLSVVKATRDQSVVRRVETTGWQTGDHVCRQVSDSNQVRHLYMYNSCTGTTYVLFVALNSGSFSQVFLLPVLPLNRPNFSQMKIMCFFELMCTGHNGPVPALQDGGTGDPGGSSEIEGATLVSREGARS